MSIIDDLAAAANHVADHTEPSVVSIGRTGRGTGFVIAPGKVLTNAHNLRDRTTSVTFADGRTEQGEVAGLDVDGDLAVVDVDTGEVPALGWGEESPGRGDVVFAAGRGGHRFRITMGLVSGTEQAFRGPRGRRIHGSVEHTAPLARGSSGGPVVDREGRVVAINTNRVGDGFYLSLPVDAERRERIDLLAAGESPRRRSLGVAVAPPKVARRLRASVGLSERDGLLVQAVEPGSPADGAGIAKGDLLVRAGDRDLESVDALHAALEALAEGEDLTLVVVRGDDERTVAASFDGAPVDDAPADEPSGD